MWVGGKVLLKRILHGMLQIKTSSVRSCPSNKAGIKKKGVQVEILQGWHIASNH